MKIKVLTQNNEEKSEMTLSPFFSVKTLGTNITEYINYVRAARRQAIADALDRGEVSGGGKKPWKQKGTGRARVGSSRSPIWIGGGVTHGPKSNANYTQRKSKKFRAAARSAIMSFFAENKRLVVIDEIKLKDNKTKEVIAILEKLNLEGKIAIFISENEYELMLAMRNIPYLHIMSKNHIDTVNLISSDYLVMTVAAYNEVTGIEIKEQDEANS